MRRRSRAGSVPRRRFRSVRTRRSPWVGRGGASAPCLRARGHSHGSGPASASWTRGSKSGKARWIDECLCQKDRVSVQHLHVLRQPPPGPAPSHRPPAWPVPIDSSRVSRLPRPSPARGHRQPDPVLGRGVVVRALAPARLERQLQRPGAGSGAGSAASPGCSRGPASDRPSPISGVPVNRPSNIPKP